MKELVIVKTRYKPIDNNKSVELNQAVSNFVKEIESLSDNSKLSCSIDKLGMILRNSKHKGPSNVEDIKVLLDKIESKDTEGYRTELISLMDQYVKNTVIE